ncbi:hypothetical protein, partial [Nostoc sp.]|uniref:hypothetical protein n=1 Tax=Nostoc sp. TaxID=1180 RepID=UPI002FF74781
MDQLVCLIAVTSSHIRFCGISAINYPHERLQKLSYMLNLSQQKLEFLATVDGQNDWHPSSFLEAVVEHYENSEKKPFDKPEFGNMMQELKKLTIGKIANFQIALNILESL